MVAAAALAAVIGAGAGIGSYATLVADRGPVTAPISVTPRRRRSTPVLDGTVAAAAAKIQPSVVTISVQAGSSGGVGSGVVLDADGHILTNNHVVEGAGSSGHGDGDLRQRDHRRGAGGRAPRRATTSP